MIQLPNGCYCSELSIFPKNWDKPGASIKEKWYINYRFYDPTRKDGKGKLIPHQRIIKGMNSYKSLGERRTACKLLFENELKMLTEHGYNPFTGTVVETEDYQYEIDPTTGFSQALELACNKLSIEKSTRSDIKSVLGYFNKALFQLKFAALPIGTIKRRHIKAALAHCAAIKEQWTSATFNKYRSYLMILFVELVENDAIESNPVRELKKMKGVRKLRQTLSKDEREKVNAHLKENYYTFWRFMQIFFHSGGRIVELLNVKCGDVDLSNQTFKVTIKKGRESKEVNKIIKDIAMPFWEELMASGNPDYFLFSKGLTSGPDCIRREQLTRRWNVHVKEKLGIEADFYSLKHLNTTEVVDALSNEDAAKLNSHESTAMVQKFYDVNAERRQQERIKKLSNTF